MSGAKTKTMQNIEQKMEDMDINTLRYQVLSNVKTFKTSWVDLGQALYTVWKDKLYKDWGYGTFDVYAKKEIGIRKETALKLLKSYYFLEKEEPLALKKDYHESAEASSLPTYESVNVLRLASGKKDIERDDYAKLKKNVLEDGKDSTEVKKDLTSMIRQREELDPKEAWQKKRAILLKRLLSNIKSLQKEIRISKLFSSGITNDIDKLINKLESEATS